jgi:N-acetylglucosamine-6-phosphate deacetylase
MRMASLNGAKVIGMADRIGILAVGKDADMVVLGDDYEVEKTILQGSVVYSRT